jgi:hypothetical protein
VRFLLRKAMKAKQSSYYYYYYNMKTICKLFNFEAGVDWEHLEMR